MLSLNNKYFIGSVYAGMLWSLGDVTEPFHVNFFDVQKQNLYRLLLCGRERAVVMGSPVLFREPVLSDSFFNEPVQKKRFIGSFTP